MSWMVASIASGYAPEEAPAEPSRRKLPSTAPSAVLKAMGATTSTRSFMRMVPLMCVAVNFSKTNSSTCAFRSSSMVAGRTSA